MAGAGALTAIQVIDACIGIVKTIIDIGRAVHDAQGLPPKLRLLFERLPVIDDLLDASLKNFKHGKVSEEVSQSVQPILKQCDRALNELKTIFQQACPEAGEKRSQRVWKGAKTVILGRDSKIDELLATVNANLTLLEQKTIFTIETAPVPTHNLPFRRDPDFIGRDSLLDQIRTKIAQPAARIAVVGLGGIGKSQIAIEYCYLRREESKETWVLWIHASNAARFSQSIREIAGLIKIRGRYTTDSSMFQLFRDWLRSEESRSWLLVLDNVDDASVLLDPVHSTEASQAGSGSDENFFNYIPTCDHGSILITSRSVEAVRRLVDQSDMVMVQPLRIDESVRLLEKRLAADLNKAEAIELATELEGMPLALTQAAAYLRQMGRRCSIKKYQDLLQKTNASNKSILDEDSGDLRRDREASNSIFLTWQVSFERLREIRPSAAEVLSLMSVCDRQSIPEALVRRRQVNRDTLTHEDEGEDEDGWGHVDEIEDGNNRSGGGASDIDEEADDLGDGFDKEISLLGGYSFTSLTTDPSTFEMHRLVQIATKKWLKLQSQLEHWQNEQIRNLCSLFPKGEFENWSICQLYYPHARAHLASKPKGQDAMLDWATLMHHAAYYAVIRGKIDDAEKLATLSAQAMATLLDEDDAKTLQIQSLLSFAWSYRGLWHQALGVQLRILQRRKEMLGMQHPATLESMMEVADTYEYQRKLEEVKRIQLEVIKIEKTSLPVDHMCTLNAMSALVWTLYRLKDLEGAKDLGLDVEERMSKTLPEYHTTRSEVTSCLGLVHAELGEFETASAYGEKALKHAREIYGEEHLDALARMSYLAITYRQRGMLQQAEDLEVDVLEKKRRLLGPKHPNTLTSMNNLACTWLDQGHCEKAKSLMLECMQLSIEQMGRKHIYTVEMIEDAHLFGIDHELAFPGVHSAQ